MRLAWTAVVPRSLVEHLDEHALVPGERYVLVVAPHVEPTLRVVRCYRTAPDAALPDPCAPAADRVPAA
jgi:hypothetical protein